MASKAEILRAELRMVELQEELLKAKAKGPAPRDLKLDLREARREYRELRDEYFAETGELLVATPTLAPAPEKKRKRWFA